MKIVFGINTYRHQNEINIRQLLCLKSLKQIKDKDNKNICLVNLQFAEDNFFYDVFDKSIQLKQSSKNYVKNSSYKFPIISEIFNTLSQQECDYFVFLNDDIILQKTFLNRIKEANYDCYIASRVDVQLCDDNKSYIPINYNIHGFDLFCIKKEWWLKNKNKFPPLIVGKYFWDTVYYVLCKKYGRVKTLNDLPYTILHPIHNGDSSDQTSEHIYNETTAGIETIKTWFYIANNILIRREDHKGIKNCIPTTNEEINSDLYIKENL